MPEGADGPRKTLLFGHPQGLGVIAATEFWDRISFHGMQSLLVLFMAEQLFRPGRIETIIGFEAFRSAIFTVTGPLSTQALASQIFGLYAGMVYLTPVAGGLVGDRLIGRRAAVTAGALMMAAGHACMVFDQTFLIALLLLILGAGLFRGNLAAQVGALYDGKDRRRAFGFQIYYAMLNAGALIAPLITGTLASRAGWHYGFGFAGLGMLVGVVVYLAGNRTLPPDPPRKPKGERTQLTARERRVVQGVLGLLPVAMLFWVAQTQIWNTYNLWARDHLDLNVSGFQIPVPWMQSVDSFFTAALLPVVLWIWKAQARRGKEPDELGKMALGCFAFAAAVLVLAAAGMHDGGRSRSALGWAIAFHAISNIGYLYFAPTAVALVSRVAPPALNAMLIGLYLTSIFFGSLFAGRIGALYELLPPAQFWLVHAIAAALAGVLLLGLAGTFRRSFGTPASVAIEMEPQSP
ncbi:peptide MFS transporter [Phenylobacterium sp.]|uniref:peptide MFS transporter n=1 Tax=Phenylobacterium sp. TaxID=1871053 RepID=UPI002ED81029